MKFLIKLDHYLLMDGKLEKLNAEDISYKEGVVQYCNAGKILSIELNGKKNQAGDVLYKVEFEKCTAPSLHANWINVNVDFKLSDKYF